MSTQQLPTESESPTRVGWLAWVDGVEEALGRQLDAEEMESALADFFADRTATEAADKARSTKHRSLLRAARRRVDSLTALTVSQQRAETAVVRNFGHILSGQGIERMIELSGANRYSAALRRVNDALDAHEMPDATRDALRDVIETAVMER